MMSKKIPQLRFEGFTDDWEERKLSSMTNYKNGKGHEDKQSTSGKLELINLNSISISGGLKHSGKFIDEADDTLQKDDLVMILSDVGHGDLLGRVALIPEDDRFVLNQRVALLRPNITADPQFLFSYINAHQYYFKAQGAGMSQLNISKGSVENFISFVPIIEEQQKIGSFFKQLDDTIALHQRKLDLLKEQKKGFLRKMFPKNGAKVPELRFAGFADDWEERKLGEVFNQTVEYINPNEANLELWSVTVERGLTPKTARYNREALVKKNDKFKVVHDGDIVYNPMNLTIGAVGFNKSEKSVAVSGYYVTMNMNSGFNNSYFQTWLKSENAIKQYKLYATGSLIEKQRVQFPTLSLIKSYIPTFEEQQKIGSFFKQIDETIALHQRKLDLLKEQKKGFLQKMFV